MCGSCKAILKLRGDDPGEVDGVWGPKTSAALGADKFSDWPGLVDPILDERMARLDGYEMPAIYSRGIRAMRQIVWAFHGHGDEQQALHDSIQALHVAQAESGCHPLANEMNWGWLKHNRDPKRRGRPQGIFASMTNYRWATRLGLVKREEVLRPVPHHERIPPRLRPGIRQAVSDDSFAAV